MVYGAAVCSCQRAWPTSEGISAVTAFSTSAKLCKACCQAARLLNERHGRDASGSEVDHKLKHATDLEKVLQIRSRQEPREPARRSDRTLRGVLHLSHHVDIAQNPCSPICPTWIWPTPRSATTLFAARRERFPHHWRTIAKVHSKNTRVTANTFKPRATNFPLRTTKQKR